MEKVCRLCLSKEALLNIFKTTSGLLEKIRICTSLETCTDDGLPKNICLTCAKSVDSFYFFREKCKENDKYLRMKLSINCTVKKEIEEGKGFDDVYQSDSNNLNTESLNLMPECKVEINVKNEPVFLGSFNKESNPFSFVNGTTAAPKNQIRKKAKEMKKMEHKKIGRKDTKIKESCTIKTEKSKELCPVCGSSFDSVRKWEEHLRTHRAKPFKCDTCEKFFKTKASISSHFIRHMNKNFQQCQLCGRLFKTLRDMRRHVQSLHEDTRVPCKLCGKMMKEGGMWSHMQSHNGGVRKFECDFCHRKFASKTCVEVHIRTHTGEKPFVCKYCPSRFANQRTCGDHQKLHTGERPYKCPVCSMGFIQLSNMKSHFRNNHKGAEFVYKKKTVVGRFFDVFNHG